MRARSKFTGYRQVLAVDAAGETAIHSGSNVLGVWAQAAGRNVASGGNLLANAGVPQAIVDAFVAARGHLGDRLLQAMRAGLDVGGEAGPVHSAGMMLADQGCLAGGGPALRLDAGVPDRAGRGCLGCIQAATRRLCATRARSHRRAIVRRARRRVGAAWRRGSCARPRKFSVP